MATERPLYPGPGEVYEGTCNGPIFGGCGKEKKRRFPEEKGPDSPFIRVRCEDCGAIAVLKRKSI